jgi:peptidoglycan hydrolase-like protein with peptidoglycan-binding domain
MNFVKCLAVSISSALLLCSCASVPPQLRALTCKNLPAGEEKLRAVQQALMDRDYDPGPPDGQMGRKTHEALRQFQADENLPATGTVDAATVQALGFCAEPASAAPATAHPPAGDPRIQEAQRLLTEQAYAPGPVDGLMGSRTREALKRFQNDRGLTVSGKADERTLEALRSLAKPARKETPPLLENPPAPPAPTPPSGITPLPVPLPVLPALMPPPEITPPVSPASAPPSGIAPPPPVSQTPAPATEIAPPAPDSSTPAPRPEIAPPPPPVIDFRQETAVGNGQSGARPAPSLEQSGNTAK